MQQRTTISLLADDVGRLRKRFASNEDAWTGSYILDRIAGHVEQLHLQATPTAGELAHWHAPGQQDAIDEALRIVDREWANLQQRLGKPAG